MPGILIFMYKQSENERQSKRADHKSKKQICAPPTKKYDFHASTHNSAVSQQLPVECIKTGHPLIHDEEKIEDSRHRAS